MRPGDTADIQAARYDEFLKRMVPDGPPAAVLVAGTYRPRDPGELYWGAQAYFQVSGQGVMEEPVLVSPEGLDLIPHSSGTSTDDLLATDTTFAPDRLDALKTAVLRDIEPNDAWAGLPAPVTVSGDIPALVERMQHGREVAGMLVPVAFVPLVAMCWFAVFLAVGSGFAARRQEISGCAVGRVSPRWWAALGETNGLPGLERRPDLSGYAIVGHSPGSGSVSAGARWRRRSPYAARSRRWPAGRARSRAPVVAQPVGSSGGVPSSGYGRRSRSRDARRAAVLGVVQFLDSLASPGSRRWCPWWWLR